MRGILSAVVILLLLLAVSVAAHGFEPISQEKYGQAKEWIAKQDPGIKLDRIVALGFEKDSVGRVLAVIFYNENKEPVKKSLPASSALYRQLIESDVHSAAAPVQARKKKVNQDGRLYFMIHNAIKATYVYPLNLNLAIDSIPARVLSGITLLTYGGTIYGSYRFTRGMELGYGRVAMMNYGGELGIAYPALMTGFVESLVDGPAVRDESMDTVDTIEDTGRFPAMKVNAWITMFTFPAGIYAGFRSGLYGNRQYGNIDITRYLGRSAFLYGFALPSLLPESILKRHYTGVACGLTMGLIPAGNYLGYRICKDREFTAGRSFLIETTGIMGGITGMMVPLIFGLEPDEGINNTRLMAVSAMGGHALGTWFGFRFHSEKPYSFWQGVFMAVSATGGAAVGFALPLVADLEMSQYHEIYQLSFLAGAWSGLVLGEKLSIALFEKAPVDRVSGLTFPVLHQWPVLLAGAALSNAQEREMEVPRVELVNWKF